MIVEKGSLIGSINSKNTITGVLNKTVEYVDPITQEKEVTPTKEIQIIEPDENYTGLSKVIVNPYTPIVDKKIITTNGISNATDDNLDGYSEVEVLTNGVDINEYFNKTVSGGTQTLGGNNWSKLIKKLPPVNCTGNNGNYTFANFKGLEIDLSEYDSSNITTMDSTFINCSNLISLDLSNCDTSNVYTMSNMFSGCSKLTTLSKINADSIANIYCMFLNCSSLTNFGGLQNLGKAYSTTSSTSTAGYTLDLSKSTKLTHDSLMNVINNLYNIATKGCNPQKLVLGNTNLAKLTDEEKKIATDKGWVLS